MSTAAESRRSVGIDFGTSTSLVAEGSSDQHTLVVPIGRATSSMPSWVGLTDAGLVVGEAAQDLPLDKIARSVKRAITLGNEEIRLEGSEAKTVDADEAIGAVLRELGTRARRSGVVLADDAIRLGCPAIWDGPQRHRLLTLAQNNGIPVTDHTLVDEPIAAGVAWISHRIATERMSVKGRLLVFDMGGGTLDIAILEVDATPGRTPEITVLASVGRDRAGDALDFAVRDDLVDQLAAEGQSRESMLDAFAQAQILREARLTKEQLSLSDRVIVAPRLAGLTLPRIEYTRGRLDEVFTPQLDDAEQLVWAAVRQAQFTHEVNLDPMEVRRLGPTALAAEIDHVVAVGGMSRVPAVVDRLHALFPFAQIHDDAGIEPDEAVVAGLAETLSYDRISLHRPGFDFVLERPNGRPEVLYQAYTPLYDSVSAVSRTELYYEATVPAAKLRGASSGRLGIRSADNEAFDLRIDGQNGLPIEFGRRDIRLRLYPDGRIMVQDGNGRYERLRVEGWPVLHGSQHAALVARRESNRTVELPELQYPHGGLYE